MALWGNWPLFKYCAEAKKGFLLEMGKGLLLMVSLVIISTIDLDDWMPGSKAPGLFVCAPQSSRENEKGGGGDHEIERWVLN